MPTIDPSNYQMLKVSAHEGVATIILNNPARKNAVTRQMHSELERIWDDVDADDDIRVSVLTGEAGRSAPERILAFNRNTTRRGAGDVREHARPGAYSGICSIARNPSSPKSEGTRMD